MSTFDLLPGGGTHMIWPTSCAALKGRVFQHPKMHCKGVFLGDYTVRVEFYNKFKIIDKERFLLLISSGFTVIP